jgi:hypothetical protein
MDHRVQVNTDECGPFELSHQTGAILCSSAPNTNQVLDTSILTPLTSRLHRLALFLSFRNRLGCLPVTRMSV